MRKIISFILAAVMVFSLAACGGSGTTDTSSSKDTSSQSAAVPEPEESIPGSEESTPETVTLTTYNGAGEVVEVEFPYDPQRIAVMDLAALDILDNIGYGDRIVGVSKGSSIDYLQDYVTNDELYNLGTIKEADREALMECEPDVIFIGGRLSSVYDELVKIAPVYMVKTDTELGVVERDRKSVV